jgi:uncharacterized protein YeaO (DUF488 family)
MRPIVGVVLLFGAPFYPERMARTSGRAGARVQTGLVAKSVREPATKADGDRILVDRLWPRGVSKERAALTEWKRELAPSAELRRWFGHDPDRWEEFRRRYRAELESGGGLAALDELRRRARRQRVTLLFGASDAEHNDAVALVQFAK